MMTDASEYYDDEWKSDCCGAPTRQVHEEDMTHFVCKQCRKFCEVECSNKEDDDDGL